MFILAIVAVRIAITPAKIESASIAGHTPAAFAGVHILFFFFFLLLLLFVAVLAWHNSRAP